jgi:hypothetical protein
MSEHMKHAVCCLQFDFLISIHSKYCLMFQVIKSLVESDPAPQIGIYIKFTGLIFFIKKIRDWFDSTDFIMNFSNSSCRLCFGLCCEVPIVVKAKPMPPSVWYLLCSLQLRSSGHFWQLWRVSLLWQHDNSPWPAQVPLNSFWPSCCRFNTMEIAIAWIRMHKTTTFIQKKHNKELLERGREDKHWIYLWI